MSNEYQDYQNNDEDDEYEDEYLLDQQSILKTTELGPMLLRYQTEADIPPSQMKYLQPMKMMFGRNVPLSNTRRIDIPRYLENYDLADSYMQHIRTRHIGFRRLGRHTSELQHGRSNEELGGFERKMGATIIRKTSSRDIEERIQPEKKSFFNRFGKKPEPNPNQQEQM